MSRRCLPARQQRRRADARSRSPISWSSRARTRSRFAPTATPPTSLATPPRPSASWTRRRCGRGTGIGKDLAGRIREIAITGDCSVRQELLRPIPSRCSTCSRLQGVGPKTVGQALSRTAHQEPAGARGGGARRPHPRPQGHGRQEGTADPAGDRRAAALSRAPPAVAMPPAPCRQLIEWMLAQHPAPRHRAGRQRSARRRDLRRRRPPCHRRRPLGARRVHHLSARRTRARPTATPRPACCCAAVSRPTCASSRPTSAAPRSSTSPARRLTTSSCAIGRSNAAGS